MSKTVKLEVNIEHQLNFDLGYLTDEEASESEESIAISAIINQIKEITIKNKVYQVTVDEIEDITDGDILFVLDLKYNGKSPVKDNKTYDGPANLLFKQLVHDLGNDHQITIISLSYVKI